ncbi:MAG: vanadium-dependent haloperoxidase [Pseudomonadota bacterium]
MEPEPGENVHLGFGQRHFQSDKDLGLVTAGPGRQTVALDGDADAVWLGRGADTLTANHVGTVKMGKGADTVYLAEGAHSVSLGRGADYLNSAGWIDHVEAGRGKDEVILEDGAGWVDLGGGQDYLVTGAALGGLDAGRGDDDIAFRHAGTMIPSVMDGHPARDAGAPPVRLDGGKGHDSLTTPDTLGDFDFDVLDDGFRLFDRLTGESVDLVNFEDFTFGDRNLTDEDLADLVSSENGPVIFASGGTQNVSVNDTDPGVSEVWNRAAIASVQGETGPNAPTIASRAYAMVHTAIYDAWAAFNHRPGGSDAIRISIDDESNNGVLRGLIEEAGLLNDPAAQAEAMSFAAYTVLRDLYPDQQALHDAVLLGRYGLDPDSTSLAARVGRDAGRDRIETGREDGSNQDGSYADTTGYVPANSDPLSIADISRWTPESVPIDPEDASPEQSFLTPHWGLVDGFALDQSGVPTSVEETQLAIALADPGITSDYIDQDAEPEPFFAPGFESSVLDLASKTITLGAPSSFGDVGETIPVSKALIGEVINRTFIDQALLVLEFSRQLGDPAGTTDNPLAPVYGDFPEGGDAGKVSAEFYEDGGGTGFPPGTSMVFAEYLSADRDLRQDEAAMLFLGVSNAVFDAGIATWEAKTFFDYVRPVRAIRELGELELIGEFDPDLGGYAAEVYDFETGGTRMTLLTEFETYQPPGKDPSPPFAEYTSGHSAFSAAGAAALRTFNGSDAFGGSVYFPPGSTLFEPGTTPAEPYTIEWATFSEAADEAGLSRLWGGIHFPEGDLHGRALGDYVGQNAYDLAAAYYEGDLIA